MPEPHLEPRRSTLAQARTRGIDMDGPKDTLAVAYVAHEHDAAVPFRGPSGTRQGASDPRVRQIRSQAP